MLHSSSSRAYSSTDAQVQVILPQLHEIRLAALTKQLSRNRKKAYINHENLYSDLKQYERYVDKEQKICNDRHTYYLSPYKKSLENKKALKQCLTRHKTEYFLDHKAAGTFGVYGGLKLKSLKNEIEKIVNETDKNTIKLRQAKTLMTAGMADGRLMDLNQCRPMLDAILNRPSLPKRREAQLEFQRPSQGSHSLVNVQSLQRHLLLSKQQKLLRFDSHFREDSENVMDDFSSRSLHLPPIEVPRQHNPTKTFTTQREDSFRKEKSLTFI
ncbi:hypothetical protein ACJMK2_037662 [Sinanodonta woodiana]|uniref:Uncharacterized protein n=1 Tax=Sinanodonta woodiana TaxID=1069815 RepID=A0ABD3WPN7_SINWO